jgi:hypothetical protein
LSESNWVKATAMIRTKVAILTRVIQVLNFSDSLEPQQLIPHRIARKTSAKGQQSLIPKTVTFENTPGKIIPNLAKSPTKYDDIARDRAAAIPPYLGSNSQPIIQAGSSPNVAYINPKADPLLGNLDISSAYTKAVLRHIIPPRINDIKRLEPAYWTAIPVKANIPAPIVLPIPYMVKWNLVKVLLYFDTGVALLIRVSVVIHEGVTSFCY